jgi:hypothetical protein
MKKRLFLILSFACLANFLLAQREEEESLPFIYKKDSSIVGEMDLKNLRFTPFVAPSVSPEVGLMLVGGGLVSFKFDRKSKILQPSSIPFSFGYSSNGSSNFNVKPSLFFKNDKNRIIGDIGMKNMPDNYWGVGYEKARKPSDPDSTTSYTRNWWQVNVKYSHQFKNIFSGGYFLTTTRPKQLSLILL